MEIIIDLFNIVFMYIELIIHAFPIVDAIWEQIENIQMTIIACLFGVPVIVVVIIAKGIPFIKKILSNL